MYQRLLKWCKDSEIILVARLQVIGGVVLGALVMVFPIVAHADLSVYISDPKTLVTVGIVNGVLMELLRRYRATDLDGPDGDK